MNERIRLLAELADKGLKWNHVLKEVFCDGELKNEITFEEIRANARK